MIGLLLVGVTSAVADPVNATLLSFGPGGAWQNGYPYWAFVPGQGTGIVPVMCNDYEHGGAISNTWLANITNLGTGDLSLTRFNQDQGALTLYREAGWLLLETRSNPINQWKDINYAVWHIFDTNSPLDGGAAAWLNAAQIEAGKGFPGIDFSRVDILTPVDQYNPDPNSIQEFLFLDGGVPPNCCDPAPPGSQTPEPGTLLLLGSGVLVVLRRKFMV
jgi:hypothetical protein